MTNKVYDVKLKFKIGDVVCFEDDEELSIGRVEGMRVVSKDFYGYQDFKYRVILSVSGCSFMPNQNSVEKFIGKDVK